MNGGAPQRFPALGSMFPICLGSATLDLHSTEMFVQGKR